MNLSRLLRTISVKANKGKDAWIRAGHPGKVIFYGVENIVTRNPVWQIFSLIKRITPNLVQLSKLPPSRLQGMVTRVEM